MNTQKQNPVRPVWSDRKFYWYALLRNDFKHKYGGTDTVIIFNPQHYQSLFSISPLPSQQFHPMLDCQSSPS